MADNTLSIREIVEKKYKYNIPNYQRGYKWTVAEVCKLLSDIYHFENKQSQYCLQNITLIDSDKQGVFNVIDGQQRLTTTLILLAYLENITITNNLTLKNLDIKYGIRENTDKFIEEEIITRNIWSCVPETKDAAWNQIWLSPADAEDKRYKLFEDQLTKWKEAGKERDHQDIYHIFSAAMTIEAWFSQTGADKQYFKDKFIDKVIFITNEIISNTDEAKIFSKINGFRVPLDGADLLRGIFITEVAREQLAENNPIERDVRLNELRVKIGLDLDAINAWWSDDKRRRYFKFFSSVADPDNVFNSDKYPINQLYKLYVETKGKRIILLDDFEKGTLGEGGKSKNKFENILAEIRELHRTMQDWYENREIYHYVGFILAQLKECHFFKNESTPFSVLWANWGDADYAPLRSDYVRKLKEIIVQSIFTDSDGESCADLWMKRITGEEKFDWYNSQKEVVQFLILLDVLAYADPDQDNAEGNMHLGKRMNAEFFENYKNMEDKEHIFPQTPIADYDLRGKNKTREEISNHLEKYWNLICDVTKKSSECLQVEWESFWKEKMKSTDKVFPLDKLDEKWYELLQKDESLRESIQKLINEFIFTKCNINLNSIGNIVLLRRGTNRSYGNDFYTLKRKKVLQDYRSHLSIRFHTRAVFAKEFLGENDSDEGFDYWGIKSIKQNAIAIVKTLRRAFFTNNN